jgi:hypothetical protein
MPDDDQPSIRTRRAPPWLPWLAWTWVALVVAAAVAEVFGLDNLRLALDFQRHLAP